MDKFTDSFFGDIVDLDDPKTYPLEWHNKTWYGLRLQCMKELGYALVFMDYVMPRKMWAEQRERVVKLCREVAANADKSDKLYWLKLAYRIEDETENLC